MHYLNETYNGSSTPYYPDHGFCCYTVYDREYDMYYSGMKAYQGASHPVGTTYFTSSTVVDFKSRLKNQPHNFEIKVEYFPTLDATVQAEKEFHARFNVGKNPKFYNVQISGGSHCGAGTVLCSKGDGTYYRVSMQEYAKGGHKHTVKGTFLVRMNENNRLCRVSQSEFDPTTMTKQFDKHVLCYDLVFKRNRRIPKSEFDLHPDRYIGITKGQCTVYDRLTHEKITIPAGTLNPQTHYTKGKAKTLKVVNNNGDVINIDVDSYHKGHHEYKHLNSLYVVRFNLLTHKRERVRKEDYDRNPNIYADLRAKHYFETEHGIFGSWLKLTQHYGLSKWLGIANAEKAISTTIHKKEINYED